VIAAQLSRCRLNKGEVDMAKKKKAKKKKK